MYSRSSLHLIGKLSLLWDTYGTVHISPRDIANQRNQEINKTIFERRRHMVNQLKEKREIDILA